jgi:hypothetical protein
MNTARRREQMAFRLTHAVSFLYTLGGYSCGHDHP